MKDKIFVFIVGLLIGAIITTAVFLTIGKKIRADFNSDILNQNDMRAPMDFNRGNMTPPTEFNQDGDFTPPEGMPDNLPENFKNKDFKDFDTSNAERGNKGNKADKKAETEDKTTTDSQSV